MTQRREAPHDAAPPMAAGRWLLFRALIGGPLLAHPGRALLAIAAIALGVALGVAVHLVNSSALNEFEIAARHLSGEADLVVRGPQGGFDESLYPAIARLPQVDAVNPAIELDVAVSGRRESLRLVGFDPLRAAQVQPSLLPERTGSVPNLFDADAMWLSPSASEWLNLRPGDSLEVQRGSRLIRLNVAGLLPQGAYRQRIAVMDIASAQWRFERLGRLNRLDVRLRPGTNVAAFQRELQLLLPAGTHAATPETDAGRGAYLTRAYRLNLDMLALVALFTGAFLVYSSQVLALTRRRAQLALLRAAGVTRGAMLAGLVGESAVVGAAGSAAGVLLGYFLADLAIGVVGADLGAGYFRNITARLQAEPAALAAFFVIGLLFAILGAAVPAWEAAGRPPARALRAGDEEESPPSAVALKGSAAAAVAAVALTFAPSVNGLPVAGYLAIALVLLAAILALPRAVASCLARIPLPSRAVLGTAIAQVRATSRLSAVSVMAIVAGFSLMVSMLIMVSSFRGSLESWLEQVLPADLYVRPGRPGDTGYFTLEEQARMSGTPGIARVEFLRSQALLLAPDRPPVTLLARSIDTRHPERTLPLNAPAHQPGSGDPAPVWVSEVAADLYGLRAGQRVDLPIGDKARSYFVAGIWRDYARQNGAIVMDRSVYEKATGDHLVNEAAVWLVPGTALPEAQHALRERLPHASRLEIATPRELRETSLAIFDRTFAVTYALEIAALVVGLFGVSVSFSAQSIARRREFGMLRHIGMTRGDVGVMLGSEGALVAAFGTLFGLATGWAIGLILIHVVNRQSFHWTMELHMPWSPLAALAAVIIAAAAATAAWSGRAAMGPDVVRAVREDW